MYTKYSYHFALTFSGYYSLFPLYILLVIYFCILKVIFHFKIIFGIDYLLMQIF